MLIKEVLKPYYVQEPHPFTSEEAKIKYETIILGTQLNNMMNTLASTHAGWEFFNAYWREYDGRDISDIYTPVHADVLVEACMNIGFTELDDLLHWVDALAPLVQGKVAKLTKPTATLNLDIASMYQASAAEIDAAIRAQCNIGNDYQIHVLDSYYYVPNLDEAKKAANAIPAKRLQYLAERRDCDDFANMARGFLSFLGYGNLAVAYMEMRLYDATDTCIGAHAVNLFIYRENGSLVVKLYEPQTGELRDPKQAYIGVGINGPAVRQEVYYIIL